MTSLTVTACPRWHFDVVGNAGSLTVVFYNFGKYSLGVPYPGGPLLVQISGTFENGTSFLKSAAATEGAEFSSLDVRGILSGWSGENYSLYAFSSGPFEKPDSPVELGLYGYDTGVYGTVRLTPVRAHLQHPNDNITCLAC